MWWCGEVGAEGVAAGGADDVLVEDVRGAGVGEGKDDAVGWLVAVRPALRKSLVVAGGELAAALVAGGEVAELDFEDGGLDGVEAGVPADLVVEVARRMPWARSERTRSSSGGGAGGDEAGVAEGGEVFGGVEAEGGGVAEGCRRGLPFQVAPKAWAASSMMARLWLVGEWLRARPCRRTGRRGGRAGWRVDALAACCGEGCGRRAGERLKVRGSMSARTGVAPQRRMALTVAKKLKGVVTTASPGPMSSGGHGEPEGVGAAGAADGVRDAAGGGGGGFEARRLRGRG